MRILGEEYSTRIDSLVKQVQELASHEVTFDTEISEEDEKWNEVNGVYRCSNEFPRISLKPPASEQTVAHELLHGVLYYKAFPALSTGTKDVFPLAYEVANEIFHLGIHSLIDEILADMKYDVASAKTAALRRRTDSVKSICAEPGDEGWRTWWTARVACQWAYNKTRPEVQNDAEEAFGELVQEVLPDAIGLSEKIADILRCTDRHDQCSLQEGLREMLFCVRDQFPDFTGIRNAEAKVVMTPLYLRRKQLSKPAHKLLELTEGTRYSESGRRKGGVIALLDRRDGRAVAI